MLQSILILQNERSVRKEDVMPHYIYTKRGATDALGLSNTNDLNYYIKKAKIAGVEPSKTIGGVEYFDVDILQNTPSNNYLKNIKQFVKKQIEKRKNEKHLQLQLFDDDIF